MFVGRKDEMCFDSHPCLTGIPQLEKSRCAYGSLNSIHENSSIDVKKQLIKLVQKCFSSDLLDDYPNLQHRLEAKPSILDLPTNPERPHVSVANFVCHGETCAIANSNPRKRNALKTTKCHLPNLV
ncbi:hypothetical protein FEM48_Zijuj10G0034400 [Ziziphus jujuba var. spinosa]|uniref:Uncharacterized protein n=1 Tax=Ziziphus jujuba var. spinosa TaxID=714518 RepID=A0A978UL09_ZIZJJ|nr:hypothetical protein FEM48_Zijuj10G0034400 [Ziziphus jujuba var. spinosa]